MNSNVFYLAAVFTGTAMFVMCLNANAIGQKLDIIDIPDERKKHKFATPLLGGVALLVAFVPSAAILALDTVPSDWVGSLLIWLACITAMAAVGIADDRHALSARLRLIISFAVFGSAATFDPLLNIRILSFEYFGFELGLGTQGLAVAFTTICCVGLVNAVNMADGKNGLVIGLCAGWIGFIALRAPSPLLPILLILIIVLIVLAIFNLRDRLFLGDGGTYGLATAIGLAAIFTYNSPGPHVGRAIAADELMLLFALPVLDSFRLAYVRLRRGVSPMTADRDHLHHHLQNWFGWPGGLVVYFVLALLPSAVFLI